MSNILRRLARLAYHVTRSKADRRHRLKHTQKFVEAMAVIDRSKLSEDELADAILDHVDASQYDEDEIAEAVYYLASTGLDDEIPDLLPHVLGLAEYGLCDPSVAADVLPSIMLMFDAHPSEVADCLCYCISRTPLTVSEAGRIIETAGVRARTIDRDLVEVTMDTIGTYRRIHDSRDPEIDLAREIRKELIQQYDAERRGE